MPAGNFQNFKTKLEIQRVFCYTNSNKQLTVSANNPSAFRQQRLLTKISSPPSGVRWYDNLCNPITGSTGNPKDASIEKYMVVGETKTLSELKLLPASYSGTNINQTFEWSVYDMDNYAVDTGRVATINTSTGALTAVAPGYSIIRGRKVLNSQDYWVTFVLYVSTAADVTWLDAFIRNAPSVKYMDIQIQYALSHRNETQADACAKGIHNGSIQTDPSKKTFPVPELTAQIHEGMTYEEVTDILGLPQYQMVRSLRVFAYKLNNGTEFAIYYSQNTNGHLL